MRLARRLGRTARALALVAAGAIALQALAPGAVATAAGTIQDVFVTNTKENPVPVVPLGTTKVKGSVTVANPAPVPVPVQKAFQNHRIDRAAPFASGEIYAVPAGKVLTLTHAQAYFDSFGDQVKLRRGTLYVSCTATTPPLIDRATVQLPEQPSGDSNVIVGGPLTLLVPGPACLRFEVGAVSTTIPEGAASFVHGSITGHLTDAIP